MLPAFWVIPDSMPMLCILLGRLVEVSFMYVHLKFTTPVVAESKCFSCLWLCFDRLDCCTIFIQMRKPNRYYQNTTIMMQTRCLTSGAKGGLVSGVYPLIRFMNELEVATLGATSTGAINNLSEIRNICNLTLYLMCGMNFLIRTLWGL
jgi:hypothetical protein